MQSPFERILKSISLRSANCGHGESEEVIHCSERDMMGVYFEIIKIALKEQIKPSERILDLLQANNKYQQEARDARAEFKAFKNRLHEIVAEFGNDPKQCLEIMGEFIGESEHIKQHGTLGETA